MSAKIESVRARKQANETTAIATIKNKAQQKLSKAEQNKTRLMLEKKKFLEQQKRNRMMRLEQVVKKRKQEEAEEEELKRAQERKRIKDDTAISETNRHLRSSSSSKYQASQVRCCITLVSGI